MEELTLTGATMLSDYPTSSTNVVGGGSSTSSTDDGHHSTQHHHNHDDHPYLMLTLGPVVVADSSNSGGDGHHQHGHNHPNNNNKKPCCSSPPVVQHRPILTLKKPAKDIVTESTNYELYHLLLQVVRMGSYELFVELITTWRSHYQAQITTSNTTGTHQHGTPIITFDRMVHAYDMNGHTITHWAAKRMDDIRIIQYILQHLIYDTTSTGNSNGTTTTSATTEQYVWSNDKELIPLQIDDTLLPTDSSTGTTNKSNVFPTPIHRPTHDSTRMTPLHWACTQENGLSVIKVLLDASMKLSNANTGSIHSTTLPAIPSILEIRDGTGCTPCLIASQHGRVETVAYLIQRGANIYAVDTARDSMIHWAAYKGSEHVLGLISYYCSDQQFYTPDAYGQTPLHLASLRGHVSVVRYILHHLIQQPLLSTQQQQQNNNFNIRSANASQQHPSSSKERMAAIRAVRDLLNLKDQNGRTPYELAIHKNKPAVAAVLKSQMQSLQRQLNPNVWESHIRQYISIHTIRQLFLLRTWKTWLGLPELDDLDESPRFPFYYVIGHMCCHVCFSFGIFIPLYDISKGVLWDYMMMLMVNIILTVVSTYSLYRCHMTNPGRLDSSFTNLQYWRRLYEQTLDSFASSDENTAKQAASVQLCHTCHIARPPRSKHDRFSRSCILQFDHHCPFVGTTVGLYNYKWFFTFILSITLYFIIFWIMLLVHYMRNLSAGQASTVTLIFGIFLGLHILFSGGMVIYHSQLIFANLTTNEHINLARYDYLWDTTSMSTTSNDGSTTTSTPRRVFHNPWDKGCLNNMYDRLIQPGDHCYLVPSDQNVSRASSAQSTIELHQPLVRRMMETV